MEIEALMTDFGTVYQALLDHPQYRWLGPHKGVVHLALSSIVNACFDLWAKARGLPLWRLLLELEPEQLVKTLHLRYLEDTLTTEDALRILREEARDAPAESRSSRKATPVTTPQIGWIQYSDDTIKENLIKSLDQGFGAVKLKVGSAAAERDIRRAFLVRETVGDTVRVMLDVNQQWTLPQAIEICQQLRPMNPYWIEEPTHPDDVLAHQNLSRSIARSSWRSANMFPTKSFSRIICKRRRRLPPARLRATRRCQRVHQRQFAGAQVRDSSGAACRRYGANTPTPGLVQSHCPGA